MRGLLRESSIQGFKDNRHQSTALWAFDLFEGLNVLVFWTVHNGEDFRRKLRLVARPVAGRAVVGRFLHGFASHYVFRYRQESGELEPKREFSDIPQLI